MLKGLVRILAFFAKELAEILRQPRLVISLVLGPFLILALFGVGYSGEQPKLRTILVVPAGMEQDPQVQALQTRVGPSFEIQAITSNLDDARQQLAVHTVSLVEVIPPEIKELFGRTTQTPIMIYYNEIDPLQEQWIRYLTYVQVKELNSALLINLASGSQTEAGNLEGYIKDARTQLQTIQAGLKVAGGDQTRTAIQRLRSNSGLLLAGLVLAGQSNESQQAQQNMQQIQSDLTALETALGNGQVQQQEQHIKSINAKLTDVEQVASK